MEIDESSILQEMTDIAKKIELPLYKWEGNCHAIATQIVRKGIIKGRVIRGHYHGPIVEESIFFGKPVVPHSWIGLEDGTIVDPTRWCFENDEPYLYTTKGDTDYEVGGDSFRASVNQRECPKVSAEEKDSVLQPFDNPEVWAYVSSLIYGQTIFSKGQLFWLANQPKDVLFPFAKPIYEGLEKVGMRAAIPIDNYRYVMGL